MVSGHGLLRMLIDWLHALLGHHFCFINLAVNLLKNFKSNEFFFCRRGCLLPVTMSVFKAQKYSSTYNEFTSTPALARIHLITYLFSDRKCASLSTILKLRKDRGQLLFWTSVQLYIVTVQFIILGCFCYACCCLKSLLSCLIVKMYNTHCHSILQPLSQIGSLLRLSLHLSLSNNYKPEKCRCSLFRIGLGSSRRRYIITSQQVARHLGLPTWTS